MFGADVRVRASSVREYRNWKRGFGHVYIIPEQRGIGAEDGKRVLHRLRILQDLRRDAIKAPQLLQKFAIVRGRWRRPIQAKLRRARGGAKQRRGECPPMATKRSRQFEGDCGAHTVSEECEGSIQIWRDGRL